MWVLHTQQNNDARFNALADNSVAYDGPALLEPPQKSDIVQRTLARRAHLPSPSMALISMGGLLTLGVRNRRPMREDCSLASRRFPGGRIGGML
jgi:hypothetical protein